MTTSDPVAERRAQIARLVGVGKRVGYALYGVAIIVFFVGFFTTYTDLLTSVIVTSLVVGSLILAPAIVFGYGVKAAEREERRLRAASGASNAVQHVE